MYGNYKHEEYIEKHKYINRESIFRVGEWVIKKQSGRFKSIPILITDVYLGGGVCPQRFNKLEYSSRYELWVPKKDEWIWVWDDKNNRPKLRQFVEFKKNNYMIKPLIGTTWPYKFAEPFIGNIPTNMQN